MRDQLHFFNTVIYASLLVAAFTTSCLGQAEHPVTGRQIANVMSVSGADWLERSEREIEELPETALEKIGIRSGQTVADVGAGSGYFTIRLAKRVGPDGKVYAVDVQPEMLTMIRKRIAAQNLANVEAVLGSETDPKLPRGALDLILMVDVYHEFSQPQKMLRRLRTALKEEGRLVLLEYRKEDPHIPIRLEHKMTVAEAKQELEAEGFRLEKALEDLPRQHILIFRKSELQ